MKKYFAGLRPSERRLVIGAGVVVFLVLNWLLVWPHFSDWGDLQMRLAKAGRKLKLYQLAAAQIPSLKTQVKTFESAGDVVAPEDQGVNFMRTISEQATASRVSIPNYSRQTTRTNDAFFVEQVQTINVNATEAELVDFLYKLGSGNSAIRVRGLELQPDQQHYKLTGSITLVASYQKNPQPVQAAKSPPPAQDANPKISAPVKETNIFKHGKRATNSTVKIK